MKILVSHFRFIKDLLPSGHLLVQSQQWKHQNNTGNLFKVNNKDTRMKSYFINCCSVSTIDLKQVNAG